MEGTSSPDKCSKCSHSLCDTTCHVRRLVPGTGGKTSLRCVKRCWNLAAGPQKYANDIVIIGEIDEAVVMPLIRIASGSEPREGAPTVTLDNFYNIGEHRRIAWHVGGSGHHGAITFALSVEFGEAESFSFHLFARINVGDDGLISYITQSPIVLRPLLFLLPKVFSVFEPVNLCCAALQPEVDCIYDRNYLPSCSSALIACAMIDNRLTPETKEVTANGITFKLKARHGQVKSEFGEFNQSASNDLTMLHGMALMAAHSLWENCYTGDGSLINNRGISELIDKNIMSIMVEKLVDFTNDGTDDPDIMGNPVIWPSSGDCEPSRIFWKIFPSKADIGNMESIRLLMKIPSNRQTEKVCITAGFELDGTSYNFVADSSVVLRPIVFILQKIYPEIVASQGLDYRQFGASYGSEHLTASKLRGHVTACTFALMYCHLVDKAMEYKISGIPVSFDGNEGKANGVRLTVGEIDYLSQFSEICHK